MSLQARLKFRWKDNQRQKGQSLVELVLLFPVLLIVLSGLVEFGFMLNEYLAILDAARNAARFSSDGMYTAFDTNHNCNVTIDFYRQTSCLVLQELAQEQPNITIEPDEHDDVIISVFAVLTGSNVKTRYPLLFGEQGWSHALDLPSHGTREQSSGISTAYVNDRLDALAPSTGLLLVEIYYSYDMKLALPWITAFIDDPVTLHVYSFMPLVSAEPKD